MRSIASVCLIFLVCPVSLLASGNEQGDTQASAVGGWTDVQKLKPATEIIVTVGGAVAVNHTFLFADAAALFVLNTTTLAQAGDAERDLRQIVVTNAAALAAGTRAQFVTGDVRVVVDGVFVAGHKIAEESTLVQRVNRDDVHEVRLARSRRRASITGAAATGAAIGAGVGLALSATIFGCRSVCAEDWTRVVVLSG